MNNINVAQAATEAEELRGLVMVLGGPEAQLAAEEHVLNMFIQFIEVWI